MFCCCCWSYVLLALVVCSNPADLRLQQALTTTTKERGHLIPGGSWRRLCAAWTLWMQIGGSKWPLTAATSACSLPWWGRDTWGLNHVKAGQDLLGGRHSLGARGTPYPPSQPTLPSHHLPNWTHISHNTWPCCKDLPGRLFNRSCVRTYIHLKVGSVRLFQIQTNCLVTAPQTNCHHPTPSLGRHCLAPISYLVSSVR